ncbi:MAG: sigma-70 family RNA polymerase sigma factor [Myxococcota bacterium]
MTTAPTEIVIRGPAWADEAIVLGLRRKDRAAALALFRRMQPFVNALVWRTMGADSEHDDLVQQSFLAALKTAHTIQDASRLEAWMRGVTLNTLRLELRRRRWRRLFRFILPEDSEQAGSTLGPDTAAAAHQLFDALEAVSADARLAFVLHVVEGYSLPEVAEAMNFSTATAKRRVREARAHLRRRASSDNILSTLIEEVDDVD